MSHPTPAQIKAARLKEKITQTKAAQSVGVSLRAWQYWEAGTRKMPPGLFKLRFPKFDAQEKTS